MPKAVRQTRDWPRPAIDAAVTSRLRSHHRRSSQPSHVLTEAGASQARTKEPSASHARSLLKARGEGLGRVEGVWTLSPLTDRCVRLYSLRGEGAAPVPGPAG
jgi:hypothetical protein